MITTKEISKQLKSVFPSLIDWLPTDKQYLTIEPVEIKKVIDKFADPLNRYIPNLWECEEISMAVIVDFRRSRLNDIVNIPVGERLNYAVGEVLGNKVRGVKKSHQLNIFIAKDGVHLFDMQNKNIWKAEKGKDDMFFVRM